MPTTTQEDFNTLETALKLNNIEDVKKILLNFDLAATDADGRNCLALACTSASSPDSMKVVLQKVEEIGGPDLLKSQLSVPYKDGENCVMFASANTSSSLGVMVLVFQRIIELCGEDLFKRLLSAKATRFNRNVLQFAHQGWKERNGVIGRHSSASREVITFLAGVLSHCRLLQQELRWLSEELRDGDLKQQFGITLFWKPKYELEAEVAILFDSGSADNRVLGDCVALKTAIHKNDYEQVQELLQNDDISKKILDSRYNIIVQACSEPKTKVESIKLLFSEIKRIGGGDQYLKELLARENAAGETCLLSVCLGYAERVGLLLDTIEEVGGEGFLAEQISKKRRSDGMTCLYALCKFAREYNSLAFFVSKIFQLEHGRRILSEQLKLNPCVECLFSRPFDYFNQKKFLLLMASLASMTGLFKDQYPASRFDEGKRNTLRRICNIESADWSHARSTHTDIGDLIGDIKKNSAGLLNNKNSKLV